MCSTSRMILLAVAVAALTTTACNRMPAPFEVKDRSPRADRDAPFDPPNTYPGWAYDSPSYMKPAGELEPAPRAKAGDPLHYFTKETLVEIRQPSGYEPEEIPRVAIWWTDNNGFHWHKGGYFGRGQTFFPFEVEEDGDYGIRFVGPGQTPAVHTPAYPERVYHVDTTVPDVEVTIDPEQSWYQVGQPITIAWRADDYHLLEYPVCVSLLMDFTTDEPKVVELQRDLDHEGSITFEIPTEALDHEIRFRVEAFDRADNLGLAYSHAIQVVEQTLAAASEVEDDLLETSDTGETFTDYDESSPVADPAEVPPRTEADIAADASGADGYATSSTDTINAAEFSLLGGGPVVVPFARADARSPMGEDRLAWHGPTASAFPSGGAVDGQRSPGGLFDTDLPVPADSVDDELAGGGDPQAADQETTDPTDAEAITMVPTDADAPLVLAQKASDLRDEDDEIAPVEVPDWIERVVSSLDLTHGNGLLIPLPATVDAQAPDVRWATAHPWRILGDVLSSPLLTVWALPRARFDYELNRTFDGQFLVDHPALRPVAGPGAVERAVAGLPADTIDTEPPILP
ncbi:MAG: hypothetical protein JXQ75_15425 [Phycisphaerae bacterium]|nr:hypothetical protein [Phycisphaerae bacterium]